VPFATVLSLILVFKGLCDRLIFRILISFEVELGVGEVC